MPDFDLSPLGILGKNNCFWQKVSSNRKTKMHKW